MKKFFKISSMLMSFFAVIIFSMSNVFAATSGVDWTNFVVRATGQGMAPPNARNATHAKMLARRAAVADAYRQLAEEVKGVTVEAGTNVEMLMVANDSIRLRVATTIKGAKVIHEKELSGNAYEVTIEVPLYGIESDSLAQIVMQRPEFRETFPQPVQSVQPAQPVTTINITINNNTTNNNTTNIDNRTNNTTNNNTTNIDNRTSNTTNNNETNIDNRTNNTTNNNEVNLPARPSVTIPTEPTVSIPKTPEVTKQPEPTNQNQNYQSAAIGNFTGLIVDCRGLGLKPVMSPVIKNDNGDKIYGYKNLDYDKIIEIGMVAYTSDINSVARAGSNPLVVRALKVVDHNSNPVISVADSNRILIENDKTGFLDKLNVVFIR